MRFSIFFTATFFCGSMARIKNYSGETSDVNNQESLIQDRKSKEFLTSRFGQETDPIMVGEWQEPSRKERKQKAAAETRYYEKEGIFFAPVHKGACRPEHRDWFKSRNIPFRFCIEITDFEISRSSDNYEVGKTYAGAIMYDNPISDRNRRSMGYPGKIIFAETGQSNLNNYYRWVSENSGRKREGMVHGYSVWREFRENPSKLNKLYGMKFAGFAIEDGVLKFNSRSLNAAGYWGRQERQLVENEKKIVRALFDAWKDQGAGSVFSASKKRRNSIWKYLNNYW